MVEPTFKGTSVSGPTSDVIDLRMHEPLTTTNMGRSGSSSTSPIYVDDIRSNVCLNVAPARLHGHEAQGDIPHPYIVFIVFGTEGEGAEHSEAPHDEVEGDL